MIASVLVIQIWHLPASSRREAEDSTKKMYFASSSVEEKAPPPVLTLELDNPVTHRMFQAPFKLMLQDWNSE